MKNTLSYFTIALLMAACNPQSATTPNATSAASQHATASSTVPTNNTANQAIKSVNIRKDNMGGDFTLTDKHGKPFAMSSLKGHVVILSFGFTNCPDVCPTELFTYSEALKQLNEAQAHQVKVVFVSVDPERDTPDLIGRYVAQFHPEFIGLTDTQGGHELTLAKQHYQIVSTKTEIKSDKLYNVDHSAGAYLLDKNGKAAYFAPYGIEAPQLAEDLKKLLNE